jgi:hypothetical protein
MSAVRVRHRPPVISKTYAENLREQGKEISQRVTPGVTDAEVGAQVVAISYGSPASQPSPSSIVAKVDCGAALGGRWAATPARVWSLVVVV